MRYMSHTISHVVEAMTLYSSSDELLEIVGCFLISRNNGITNRLTWVQTYNSIKTTKNFELDLNFVSKIQELVWDVEGYTYKFDGVEWWVNWLRWWATCFMQSLPDSFSGRSRWDLILLFWSFNPLKNFIASGQELRS